MAGMTYIPLINGVTNFVINSTGEIAVHDEFSGKVVYGKSRVGAQPTGVYVQNEKIVRVEYKGE